MRAGKCHQRAWQPRRSWPTKWTYSRVDEFIYKRFRRVYLRPHSFARRASSSRRKRVIKASWSLTASISALTALHLYSPLRWSLLYLGLIDWLAISGVAAAKKTKAETNSVIDLSKLPLSWHQGNRALTAISARIKHQWYKFNKIQEKQTFSRISWQNKNNVKTNNSWAINFDGSKIRHLKIFHRPQTLYK